MIKRAVYLNQINEFIDKPFVKVLTGIRRSGKSTFLMMIRDELLSRGIKEEQILYFNFESFEFSNLQNALALHQFVKSKIVDNRRYYILLMKFKKWKIGKEQ